MSSSLYVSDEAETALALVAAGGDLHHGLGTAADYALHKAERERERERERSEISCHSIFAFALSIEREGRREFGGSFACYAATFTNLVLLRSRPLHLVPRHRLDEPFLQAEEMG